MSGAVHLRAARLDDLPAMIALMKQDYRAVGFIPRMGLERAVSAGLVHSLECEGDFCGYGYRTISRDRATMRIMQLLVRRDARMVENGKALLGEMGRGFSGSVSCRCAADLEAVNFWGKLGFSEVGRARPDNWRRREIIHFIRGGIFPPASAS